MLLARHKKIVTDDEKRTYRDNPKIRNHGDYLATRQHPQQNRIFMEKKTPVVYLVRSAGCADPVKNYLKALDGEVLHRPPYSPDIASSDYHLFQSMAHALSEQRFTSYEDTKN
ncbi:Mariner Mos1 transposase [Eumeta japonica]|uniref:Mariner Mos1 transposase n=1 Tax=Eumeta variegata TaxID=151549 RepID=A0A4C1VXC5_EUMVA|nr:Mariner Mos1 transposase [Eumeta japonica]